MARKRLSTDTLLGNGSFNKYKDEEDRTPRERVAKRREDKESRVVLSPALPWGTWAERVKREFQQQRDRRAEWRQEAARKWGSERRRRGAACAGDGKGLEWSLGGPSGGQKRKA